MKFWTISNKNAFIFVIDFLDLWEKRRISSEVYVRKKIQSRTTNFQPHFPPTKSSCPCVLVRVWISLLSNSRSNSSIPPPSVTPYPSRTPTVCSLNHSVLFVVELLVQGSSFCNNHWDNLILPPRMRHIVFPLSF